MSEQDPEFSRQAAAILNSRLFAWPSGDGKPIEQYIQESDALWEKRRAFASACQEATTADGLPAEQRQLFDEGLRLLKG